MVLDDRWTLWIHSDRFHVGQLMGSRWKSVPAYSVWLSTRPTSLLVTYVENARWALDQLGKRAYPPNDYFAFKADEYDFLYGQLELRLEKELEEITA